MEEEGLSRCGDLDVFNNITVMLQICHLYLFTKLNFFARVQKLTPGDSRAIIQLRWVGGKKTTNSAVWTTKEIG